MKAVISTTYDDQYLFFLPIVTFLWNKLGVDVICFMPEGSVNSKPKQISLIGKVIKGMGVSLHGFTCHEHKEATYAQCSRLYAACLDLPEDEILVVSDIDMGVFSLPPQENGGFVIYGADLVPPKQYPMCYISATAGEWRRVFELNGKHYQDCLDKLLGDIECENMRGNYWGKDQEESYLRISQNRKTLINRALPETQFATKRVDRDDAFWRDRITPDLVDAHLWRPGYTDENFANILELIETMYPNEDLTWMVNYQQQYKNLL